MARTVSIGAQSFEDMRTGNYFMVDKTSFIRDWWNSGDQVTLLCRPRRFGKTLTLSMVECFLSTRFYQRGEELFGGLDVWKDPCMRELQGTVPVVAVSLAGCKGTTLDEILALIRQELCAAVRAHDYLCTSSLVDKSDRVFLDRISDDMDVVEAKTCLRRLCRALFAHWGVRPVVLLDEYDTPMQEAWLHGCWDGMSDFIRGLLNPTFKTNPDLGRGLLTGITRVASESIFSDLNNLSVVTVTTPAYQTSLGFTRKEVEVALQEFGMAEAMADVERWYDGYSFGGESGIYNPWSVTCFLARRRIDLYWANSSSNALISSLIRRGDPQLKSDFELLLAGASVVRRVDERVDFEGLRRTAGAVWSLLLASGYGRADSGADVGMLSLSLSNAEVRECMDELVGRWFEDAGSAYNEFCRALLVGDTGAMEDYLSAVCLACASNFDGGVVPSASSEPERFYHGLVLGLLVELRGRYTVESNRESGFGRYDVALVPVSGSGIENPILIEFKVFNPRRGESTLDDTVANALDQIERRRYADALVERGFALESIRRYGMGFRGKEVRVGS